MLRTEDPALLTGDARFLADLPLDGAVHAVICRSDVAHGLLRAVHRDDAQEMPGVVAVWTAGDLALSSHHAFVAVHDDFARPPLAVDRVRFVGEPIAVVLAETAAEAEDAAHAVWAEVDELPAVIDAEQALEAGAPLVFPDHGSNLAMTIADERRVELHDCSDVVVRGRYVNQRVASVPLETDGCAAEPLPDGRLRVWVSTQTPHVVHRELCAALGVPADVVHVRTPQVGGGFGGKLGVHAEHVVIAACARRLGRPVTWSPARSDDMKALPHGRGQVQYVELGCRRDGRFTGLRVRLVGDAGAYPTLGAFIPGGTRRMIPSVYRIEQLQCDVAVAVTTTTPVGAYRGAGRPEASTLIERLVDQAARALQIDPIELRLRNMIGDDELPYTTVTGHVYDSGRYGHALRTAADAAGYAELRREQARRRADGDPLQLGVGISVYVEVTAGGSAREAAALEVHDDGTATVYAGTASHGQGHATAYAMLVADRTGISIERIRLVDGDTALVASGSGTAGSRSLQLGGSAVRAATDRLVRDARALAAAVLEADVHDVVVDVAAGTFGVAGVPASALTWMQLASLARAQGTRLRAEETFDQGGPTYPFGAHIAVVEVDTGTGAARLVRHVGVDDCGTVLNPVLVEGQQHGGIAAAAGQALFEAVRYDDQGNPLTATLADYAMPAAAELPSFEVHSTQTPTRRNPLGAKGIGEAATIGATPAIQNAVIDAVAHLGVRHIDMPCAPEAVWRAIRDASSGASEPWQEPPAIFAAIASSAGADEGVDAAEGA